MKRFSITLVIVMALLAISCTTDHKFGYVTFGTARDVFATIDYPMPEGQIWTVTATKTSRGSKTGEGVYNDVLLTDSLGPFSVGQWTFVFDSELYHGETSVQIVEGANSIDIQAKTKGGSGKLIFENCNIPAAANGVYIFNGEEKILGMGEGYMDTREDGVRVIPRQEYELEEGIYDITVTYNSTTMSETFKIRVLAGLETTVSFGIFEGRMMFNVTVEKLEALVE